MSTGHQIPYPPRPVSPSSAAPGIPLICFLVICFLAASCSRPERQASAHSGLVLTIMPAGENAKDTDFFTNELARYRKQTGVEVKILTAYDSVDTRVRLLEDVFSRKQSEPDICGIDNTWPGLFADDLIDLRPHLGSELAAIDAGLLDAFTVDNRLVALPETFEVPVLYYRTDLLAKYHYRRPPETWDELEKMALVIQTGERRGGNRDFWGYIWQGAQGETLTCNAMEWQRGDGVSLIDKTGAICADSPAAESSIRRARSWVGRITPPSVVEYDEEDAANFWLAGGAAFARGWPFLYGVSRESPNVKGRFKTVPMPAGRVRRAAAFGGMGLSVSRYSQHVEEAVRVVRFLLSEEVQRRRLIATGAIPSLRSLTDDMSLLQDSAFDGWRAGSLPDSLFRRPSVITGKKYQAVSNAYSKAVHEAICGRADVHTALSQLQGNLERMLPNGSPKSGEVEAAPR